MVIGRTAGGQGPWKATIILNRSLAGEDRGQGRGVDMEHGGEGGGGGNSGTLSNRFSLYGLGFASRRQVEEAGVTFF